VITALVRCGEIKLPTTSVFACVERKMHKICSPLECAHLRRYKEDEMGRAILLWLLGVPIPIIILIALLWH